MKKKDDFDYTETLLFIQERIRTFRSSLEDDKFMDSPGGALVRIAIKSNYIFKRVLDDPKLKKKIIRDLSDFFGKDIIDRIIKNIDKNN